MAICFECRRKIFRDELAAKITIALSEDDTRSRKARKGACGYWHVIVIK